MTASDTTLDLSRYKLGWSDEEDYVFKPKRGLNEDILQEMSWMKGEPDWMRKFRLKSYDHFTQRKVDALERRRTQLEADITRLEAVRREVRAELIPYKQFADALKPPSVTTPGTD